MKAVLEINKLNPQDVITTSGGGCGLNNEGSVTCSALHED